ncbi:MAG TPA: ankyrin repeat domain-containing protein [Rhodothermia bacterium]|nr:ankyrin repeat domain-containing protein [Rhodothermia bacterium]
MRKASTVTRITGLFVAVAICAALGYVYFIHDYREPETGPSLLEAIRRSDLSAMESYLGAGGPPEARIDVGGRQMSLLQAAIADREEDIAVALLDAGATFEGSEVDATYIGTNGLTEVVRRLLPIPPDRPIAYTGLVNAADNGYYDVVEVYLQQTDGRSDEWAREYGRAANVAISVGYDDVARLLVEAGASPDELLHTAARFSSAGMIRYLLARGLDVNEVLTIPGAQERTPIDFAWRRYQDEQAWYEEHADDTSHTVNRSRDVEYVLFELVRAGARIDTVDLGGVAKDVMEEIALVEGDDRKLIAAARVGLFDLVDELLDNKRVQDKDILRTAVMVAFRNDHDDIARRLLEFGAPVDGGVLHAAASTSSPGMVRWLMRNGADHSERVDGATPLDVWFAERTTIDPELVLHELIVAGADVCGLVEKEQGLPGLSAMILRDSATSCWDN